MNIDIDVRPEDIEPALNWVSGYVGAALDRRVSAILQQQRRNPLLTSYFQESFGSEFALATVRRYRKNTGRIPINDTYELLYGQLVVAQRIHRALPHNAKRPFEGRLKNFVNGPHGIRPFFYEIGIATHLMRKRWDVEFADLCGLGNFDFLARNGATEIEVECKKTSPDTGRKIHRQELNRLADLLLPTVDNVAQTPGVHLIQITVPDKLNKSTAELSEIVSVVEVAIRSSTNQSGPFGFASYRFEDLAAWPNPADDPNAREFFEAKFAAKNAQIMFNVRPGHSIVAVHVGSEKPDNVIGAIADEAKDAAKQCSRTRPALVVIELSDRISHARLKSMLKSPNGLHVIAGTLFEGDNRSHVDSVIYSTPPMIFDLKNGTKSLMGSALTLHNPSPQFPCEAIRHLFI